MGLPVCRRLKTAGHDLSACWHVRRTGRKIHREGFPTHPPFRALSMAQISFSPACPTTRPWSDVSGKTILSPPPGKGRDPDRHEHGVAAVSAARLSASGGGSVLSPLASLRLNRNGRGRHAHCAGFRAETTFNAMSRVSVLSRGQAFHLGGGEEARFSTRHKQHGGCHCGFARRGPGAGPQGRPLQ